MARQREYTHIVQPFTIYLEYKGWFVMKTHGNQFQAGFPDSYISHPQYSPRWVEFKVQGHGFTEAQCRIFPRLIANGVPIYIIEGKDFRGTAGKELLILAYKKLFRQPNCGYYLLKATRGLRV